MKFLYLSCGLLLFSTASTVRGEVASHEYMKRPDDVSNRRPTAPETANKGPNTPRRVGAEPKYTEEELSKMIASLREKEVALEYSIRDLTDQRNQYPKGDSKRAEYQRQIDELQTELTGLISDRERYTNQLADLRGW